MMQNVLTNLGFYLAAWRGVEEHCWDWCEMQITSGSVHQRDFEYSTMVGNHQQCSGMIFISVVRCSESGGVGKDFFTPHRVQKCYITGCRSQSGS